MNFRLLLCIGMGVFVAHLGVFMILAKLRPQPKPIPRTKPNFSAKAYEVTNAETGEKVIYREITVSTKLLAPPTTPSPDKPVAPTVQTPAPAAEPQ